MKTVNLKLFSQLLKIADKKQKNTSDETKVEEEQEEVSEEVF
jgi:hypothetical protein